MVLCAIERAHGFATSGVDGNGSGQREMCVDSAAPQSVQKRERWGREERGARVTKRARGRRSKSRDRLLACQGTDCLTLTMFHPHTLARARLLCLFANPNASLLSSLSRRSGPSVDPRSPCDCLSLGRRRRFFSLLPRAGLTHARRSRLQATDCDAATPS